MDRMNDVIKELTEEFKNNISNEEDLVEAFNNFMQLTLNNCKEELEKGEFDLVEKILRDMGNYISRLPSIELKRKMLINDKYFEKLRMTSGTIFEEACKVLKGNKKNIIRKNDLDKKINEMKEYMKMVKPHNLEEAKRFLSEAALDAEFIKNPNTDMFSFRLYREKENNLEEEER